VTEYVPDSSFEERREERWQSLGRSAAEVRQMTVRVGVVGTGNIGFDHIRRLARRTSGAEVTLVSDIDASRAREIAVEVGAGVAPDGETLIHDDRVDAVLVTTSGESHAALTLACLQAGKPVLCEKPLAPTTSECLQVMDEEVAIGQRLVRVGFMRRLDPGYLAVHAAIETESIGDPLILHHIHRNPSVPDSFTSDLVVTDAIVHEIDITRWLLGEEIVAVQAISPARTPEGPAGLQDPQFVVFRTAAGRISAVECFVNATYGYDVRCEVVGSIGTASLVNPRVSSLNLAGLSSAAVPGSWRTRFDGAYCAELQEWIDDTARAVVAGPSVWDGYAATRVAEAAVESIASGAAVQVDLVNRPALYGWPGRLYR
jgi:myo-inositol 2-dehydrogenase/D-chiro-inositol 1-dehydrogenase